MMLSEYRFDSDPEAIKYIQGQLSKGHTLSTYLLHLPLPVDKGHIAALYIPLGPQTREASKYFETGVTRYRETNKKLATIIQTYLSHPGRYAIIEETCALLGDSSVQLWQEKYFTYQSEIYYFLTHQDREIDEIIRVLNAPSPFPFIGILTSLPEDVPGIQDRQEVTRHLLENLAEETTYLLVGAYDGTGYLIWHG